VADPRREAVERFQSVCERDELVAAAFLGGSLASGTADDVADFDLYVVTEDEDYDELFARREDFVRAWGDPVLVETTRDFFGLGFDMLHVVLRDGAWGEVALGRRSTMLALHGGPYEVLVDKAGVLDGVSFPLYTPSEDERRAQLERALRWFWLDVIMLSKRLARGQLLHAQAGLASMRERCEVLLDAARADVERLVPTFVASDPAGIAGAAAGLCDLHRELGEPLARANGVDYPHALAAVAAAKLARAAPG
jgi:hypothetical protein